MMRVFAFDRIVVAASMLAAVGIVGCASSQPAVGDDEVAEDSAALEEDAAAEAESEPTDERGPKRGPGMRGHGPGGPERVLFRAAEALDLTDAQRAELEAIGESLKPGAGERGPRPDQVAELAAAIRRGSVNVEALAPKDGEGPRKEHRARHVAAVQKLHDLLTPAQRQELTLDLRAKMAEHAGGGPKHAGGGPKHPPDRAPGPGQHGPHGEGAMGFLLHGLDVSDEQEAKIAAALDRAGLGPEHAPARPDFAAMRAQADAALAAFAKDDFDAATTLPEPPASEMGRGPKRFVESLAVIVPLLDAEQRESLAQRIEDGPLGHHGRRGPRGKR